MSERILGIRIEEEFVAAAIELQMEAALRSEDSRQSMGVLTGPGVEQAHCG